MEESEESTTDTYGYTDDDRQGIVDTMVTVMLQLVQEDPWMAVPTMMDRMVLCGPLHTREEVIELFRGRPNFMRAVARIEILRTAVVNEMVQDLPMTTRVPVGEVAGWTIPGVDRYIGWWAPCVTGDGPAYRVGMIPVWSGELRRYPHREEDEYTEDYLRGLDVETSEEEEQDEN